MLFIFLFNFKKLQSLRGRVFKINCIYFKSDIFSDIYGLDLFSKLKVKRSFSKWIKCPREFYKNNPQNLLFSQLALSIFSYQHKPKILPSVENTPPITPPSHSSLSFSMFLSLSLFLSLPNSHPTCSLVTSGFPESFSAANITKIPIKSWN